jgi:hypothetical protein
VSESSRVSASPQAPANGCQGDAASRAFAVCDIYDKWQFPPFRQEFNLNLIPYNPTGMYAGSTRKAIAAFKGVLDAARLPATVRLTRGREIAAACG